MYFNCFLLKRDRGRKRRIKIRISQWGFGSVVTFNSRYMLFESSLVITKISDWKFFIKFRLFNTANSKLHLLVTGIEPWICGVRSDCCANWAQPISYLMSQYWLNSLKIKQSMVGRHSYIALSATIILRPQVQFPSTPSIILQFVWLKL